MNLRICQALNKDKTFYHSFSLLTSFGDANRNLKCKLLRPIATHMSQRLCALKLEGKIC